MSVFLLAIGLAACSVMPQVPDDITIECGPVADRELCEKAVAAALAAQLNPPPAVAVQIRLPRADDDCRTWFHPCDGGTIIAVIQSGDTLQEVPLIPTMGGWARLDTVR